MEPFEQKVNQYINKNIDAKTKKMREKNEDVFKTIDDNVEKKVEVQLKYKECEKQALDAILNIQKPTKYYNFFNYLYKLFRSMVNTRHALFGSKAEKKSDFYKNVSGNVNEKEFNVSKILEQKYSRYSVLKKCHIDAINDMAQQYMNTIIEVYSNLDTGGMKTNNETIEVYSNLDTGRMKTNDETMEGTKQKAAYVIPDAEKKISFMIKKGEKTIKVTRRELGWEFKTLKLPEIKVMAEKNYAGNYPVKEM